jgi:hypothetical protein
MSAGVATTGCDENESPARRLQRVYNRGRFDGLRLAGIDPEQYMRARKLAEAEASLNSAAHKVLEAIPTSESWPLHRIHGVLALKGCQMAHDVVEGSVNHAIELGLARETNPGMFTRIEWKEPRVVPMPTRPADPPRAVASAPVPAPAPAQASDPLSKLASLSSSMRLMASNLTAMADAVDEQTLAFAERLQRVETDGDKLKQLRTLLASLAS